MKAVLRPINIPVEIQRDPKTQQSIVKVPHGDWEKLGDLSSMQLVVLGENLPEPSGIAGRFVAKVGIEALCHRVADDETLVDELVDQPELDAIRTFARFGAAIEWPVSMRRIYPSSARWTDPVNGEYQLMNEFDFLMTDRHELYFVLAVFGQEYAINMGGPDLNGWYDWLSQNDGASPLHHGKNVAVNQRTN